MKKRQGKIFTNYGYRGYRTPIDKDGNPLAVGVSCIPAKDWCDKYFYSVGQLKTLCKKRTIFGLFHSGNFYVLDKSPDDQEKICREAYK